MHWLFIANYCSSTCKEIVRQEQIHVSCNLIITKKLVLSYYEGNCYTFEGKKVKLESKTSQTSKERIHASYICSNFYV